MVLKCFILVLKVWKMDFENVWELCMINGVRLYPIYTLYIHHHLPHTFFAQCSIKLPPCAKSTCRRKAPAPPSVRTSTSFIETFTRTS